MEPLRRLFSATKTADYGEIVAALEDGADPNQKNDKGETSVMLLSKIITDYAPGEIFDGDISSRVINSLELLLSKGADIMTKNNFGQNALFYAAGSHGTLQLKWLLNRGDGKFWVGEYDNFGNSCLHGRQMQDDKEGFFELPGCHSISILCHFGASPTQPNKYGIKPPEMLCTMFQPDRYCWAYQDFTAKVTYLREQRWVVSNRSKVKLWADELQRMAQENILPALTLRDLFSQNRYKMSKIISNESLIRLHYNNNGDFTAAFPEFGLMMNGKVKQAIHRNAMIDKFSKILDTLTEYQVNEIDVYRKIFKYLPDWQMRLYCAYDFAKYLRCED